ncbi:MAG: DUF4446 family protein [Parasporobacterium sp.]|nr:DUF4446 family protein [Parasporobacterium sp.]
MDQNTLTILVAVLALLCVVAIIAVILLFTRQAKLQARLDRFLVGQDGEDLEAAILNKFARLNAAEDKCAANEQAIRDIYRRLQGAYQKSGVVKYDAYTENGGKLSFAIALLNERDNGFVMNVMNGRDGSYCYIKEIEKGSCSVVLGREEGEALQLALNQVIAPAGRRGRNVRH